MTEETIKFSQTFIDYLKDINDQVNNFIETENRNDIRNLSKADKKKITDYFKKNFIPSIIDTNTSLSEIINEKPDKSEKTSSKPNHMSVENKVIDFVADFMVERGYEKSDTYSQLQIRKAMSDYVQEEREKNPDKINVKPENEEKQNGRLFHATGILKKFFEDIIKIIKEDIKIVEKDIKEKEAENKKSGETNNLKQIENQKSWVSDKKELIGPVDIKSIEDYMKYCPFCKEDRDPISKSIIHVSKEEKKEKKEKSKKK